MVARSLAAIPKGGIMLIKVISLAFDTLYGGFNDEDVREFIKDKEIISVTDYHFVKNDVPYLTFIFRYFPHRAEMESKADAKNNKREPDDDWKKLLSEADMGLFNLLREWRTQRCKKEGVPPAVLP